MDDFLRPKKRSPLGLDNVGRTPAAAQPVAKRPVLIPDDDIPEPKFVPPEELADDEIMSAAKNAIHLEDPAEQKPPKVKKPKRFNLHMPHGKKQWIITVAVILALLGGGGSAYWFVIRKPVKPVVTTPQKVVVKEEPKITTEVSKLSGLTVPIGTNLKPVTAVMIENSPDARPQAGLKDASVVFEAISEGGITRFCAIFQDTAPTYVGPIRSVRPYYIDWFWPFDASIAHVGGSPQALSEIRSLGVKDLDQFANGGFYERISSRFAPHNVYSSIERLNGLETFKNFTSANYTGFERKKESIAVTPTAKSVTLNISSYYYNVQYAYDATTNTYKRSEGGQIHKDDKTGVQLSPKVVVAIVMSRGIAQDGQHTDYKTTGTGSMYVFQDGIVQEGTWSKPTRQAQWVFTDKAGKVIAFNPGQTWISMVDSTSSVIYTP